MNLAIVIYLRFEYEIFRWYQHRSKSEIFQISRRFVDAFWIG